LALTELGRLRRRNAELESRLTELTEESRNLRRFVAEAAHELMEPLVTVESAVLQLEADLGPWARAGSSARALGVITSVAARGRLLVEALLQDARSAEHEPRLRPVALSETVAEAVELITRGSAHSRRISVGPLPTVVTNPELMSIVMRNLVVNAVKYGARDAGEIRVTARRERRHWSVSVLSPGGVLSEEAIQRILRPFERGDAQRARGTGLGLSICARLLERLGGRLDVVPEGKRGNRFVVLLPDIAQPRSSTA